MTKVNLVKQYFLFSLPFVGFFIGYKLDNIEDERLSRFRDKSALYRREVPPAVPSW